MKSSNIFEFGEPTPDQLANPDNVFSLVWRIECQLHESGLVLNTIQSYTKRGLLIIFNAHTQQEFENYSETLTSELVAKTRYEYEQGLISRSKYQNIRKASFLLSEMHRTGKITLSRISDWNYRKLQPAFTELLIRFCENVNQSGAFAKSSVTSMKSAIRTFLFELESRGHQSLNDVTLAECNDIITALYKRYAGGLNWFSFCIRVFLRYLHEHNLTQQDLSLAVPEVVAPRVTYREGFTVDEIERLLDETNQETAIGKRDYAIMILATQTGLRACDVVNLKRQDIDWHRREINISQEKTKVPLSIPLKSESAEAIADYLLNARRKSDLPYVFLCHTGVSRPIKNRSASAIVTRYLHRTGIACNASWLGFHSFRRAFGTRLLQNETSIELLRQLMGHTKIDSAKPYLSVDEQGLKSCALGLIPTGKAGD